MLTTMQVICVLVAAIAMLPAVAHALELPGKMRLERDVYVAVQRIYYPGFTIAGFAEIAAIAVSFVLLFLTPAGSLAFWLSASAFVALLAMHTVYWLVTHPVNKAWVDPAQLGTAGATFFETGRAQGHTDTGARHRRQRRQLGRAARSVGVLARRARDPGRACVHRPGHRARGRRSIGRKGIRRRRPTAISKPRWPRH